MQNMLHLLASSTPRRRQRQQRHDALVALHSCSSSSSELSSSSRRSSSPCSDNNRSDTDNSHGEGEGATSSPRQRPQQQQQRRPQYRGATVDSDKGASTRRMSISRSRSSSGSDSASHTMATHRTTPAAAATTAATAVMTATRTDDMAARRGSMSSLYGRRGMLTATTAPTHAAAASATQPWPLAAALAAATRSALTSSPASVAAAATAATATTTATTTAAAAADVDGTAATRTMRVLVLGAPLAGKSAFVNRYRAAVCGGGGDDANAWPQAPVGHCGRVGTRCVSAWPDKVTQPSWLLIDTPGHVYMNNDDEDGSEGEAALLTRLVQGVPWPTTLPHCCCSCSDNDSSRHHRRCHRQERDAMTCRTALPPMVPQHAAHHCIICVAATDLVQHTCDMPVFDVIDDGHSNGGGSSSGIANVAVIAHRLAQHVAVPWQRLSARLRGGAVVLGDGGSEGGCACYTPALDARAVTAQLRGLVAALRQRMAGAEPYVVVTKMDKLYSNNNSNNGNAALWWLSSCQASVGAARRAVRAQLRGCVPHNHIYFCASRTDASNGHGSSADEDECDEDGEGGGAMTSLDAHVRADLRRLHAQLYAHWKWTQSLVAQQQQQTHAQALPSTATPLLLT